MAKDISVVSPATEISLAPAIKIDYDDYTLDLAIFALNCVEEDMEDCMDWATFGVGGPA